MTAKNKLPEKLVEIKKGQTGTGILIESDGYVSRDLSENNKKIIKEAFESRENGEWNVPNPFVLDVVLQKFGIQNANGRIYPEHILKREVEKYQTLIADRMALGECYTPDAECFTSKGWVSIVDVHEGDEIFTLNTETNTLELQKVTFKTETDWDGAMYNIKDYFIDDNVTPNHGFPIYVKDSNDKMVFSKFMTASELVKNTEDIYLPYLIEDTLQYHTLINTSYSKFNYTGKVYCVEVPNHTWYVKQNGNAHWTKNCNHPAESTIDLGRISHNIIECHWEGHTLVGKIEFNLTEGFRRYGICSSLGDTCANLIMNGYKIGVSSRGVGSVKTQLGKTIVDDDFELLCWDIVATPSTPGSYIGVKPELQQYVESNETVKYQSKLHEKINKIKNILI